MAAEQLEDVQVMYFEDFELGRTYLSEPRQVTPADLELFTRLSGDDNPMHTGRTETEEDLEARLFERPVLQGAFGIAIFTGFVRRLGLDGPALALLDTNWKYLAPIYVHDTISCEITVTRKRPTRTAGRGIIHRHVVLRNQDNTVLQQGTSAFLVQARGAADVPPELQFGTAAWGQALIPYLDNDKEFTAAIASYDGTIGLAAGEEEVHFRCYRGRIIEAARRSLLGADFTLGADEYTWTQLILGDTNDFMQRAMLGQFTVRGSGAEYLRMTKVLIRLVDAARAAARKDNAK
ncbi:MaoC family dehydratase [Pseudarthrobacter sp. H2]|uniref:MaoC family dehydratase n=1 Tax=Pseudarthrobacter sp. H2 TaxID=3418415 RepID=UPI003CFB4B97